MMKNKKINVQGSDITIVQNNTHDYISLTDIAKYKTDDSSAVIANWMRNRNTIEFLGVWETLYNPNFKPLEFEGFKKQAGLNAFTLSPQKWINTVNAIGFIVKSGRYGGTFAHKDIAFKFASWISVEFELYIVKEFQRLKEQEQKQLGWNLQRTLAKINYRIHTDAIKENLIPRELPKEKINFVYANEADLLNVALFGMTAKDWREAHPKDKGNIRDFAMIEQLVVLSNLESINAMLIHQGLNQSQRIIQLNTMAITQMKSLLSIGELQNRLESKP
jgi:hypothetical protein